VQSSTVKSKSFWTGLAIIVTGIGMCVMGQTTEGIQTIAGGVVTIFVRDAISKIS
jgi:hypothetical protein